MATPVLGSVGTATQALGITTLTIPFTLAAGETLFVAFNAGAPTLVGITSVVWNGSENMTLVGAATAGSTFRTCRVYGLVGATAGTFNVVVTFASSVNAALGVAFSYSNVNPTTPWDSVQTASGNTSTTPSVTMTSATGDLCVAAYLGTEVYGGFTPSNGTERLDTTTANASYVLLDRAGQASCQINGTVGVADTFGFVGFNLNATVDSQDIPVTNANLQFTPANVYSDGGGAMASTNIKASSTYALLLTPGGGLKFKYTVASGGTGYLAIQLDTSSLNGLTAGTCPTIEWNYDKRPYQTSLLAYSASTVELVLETSLAVGTHDIEINFKSLGGTAYGSSANRWGTTAPTFPLYAIKLTAVVIDSTGSVPSQTVPSDVALFFGASYSEGYNVLLPNNDAANDGANAMANARLAFPRYIAQALGMQCGIVAYGGQGFTKGIGNATASSTNPSFYNSTANNQSWNRYCSTLARTITSPVTPAVVVIDFGYNDAGLTATPVTAVLDAMRTDLGSSTWIFVLQQHGSMDAAIQAGVAAVADTRRTKYITYTDWVTEGTPSAYSGDAALSSSHPNQLGAALRATEVLKAMQAFISAAPTYPRSRIVNATS